MIDTVRPSPGAPRTDVPESPTEARMLDKKIANRPYGASLNMFLPLGIFRKLAAILRELSEVLSFAQLHFPGYLKAN